MTLLLGAATVLILGTAAALSLLVAAVRSRKRGPRKFMPKNVEIHPESTVAIGLRRSPGQRRALAGLRLSDGGTR